MSALNPKVLSLIESNIVTYHICNGISSSMNLEDFESGFGLLAAVAPPLAEHEVFYYQHHRINEIVMKFIIVNDKLRVEFGTYDLFEKELQPILRN